MQLIDNLLDKITMYRLVLYELIVYLGFAATLSFFKILPFNPLAIILSSIFLVAVCLVTNELFAYVFETPTNIESAYITALILACIISPMHSVHDLPFLGWAAVLAMASKYILSIGKKHIFNPAAIAVVITAFALHSSATWWICTLSMMPIILLGGILTIRKIEREDLFFSFLMTTLFIIISTTIVTGKNLASIFNEALFRSPLFFFPTIMLTEPLTTPPTKPLRILYGVITGFFFSPEVHIASFYFTPELALVIGNVFSYIVSPKQKLFLTLSEKLQLSQDTFDFVFTPKTEPAFSPGQYMEWTLTHNHADSRGNRRYFTIASSPTEANIRLGVKFYQKGSSYKRALLALDNKQTVIASQLAGDFTLPKDKSKKLVFIAGGIGITPFRSMIKYLVDTKEKRDIILLFANKNYSDIIYTDVFNQAKELLGIKTVYVLTGSQGIPQNWQGEIGRITARMLQKHIPDYKERMYYLSGPHEMVVAFRDVLGQMGIAHAHIVTDFFPGYA